MKIYLSKKAYLQISFAWMFALIVGAIILFLAIFTAMKIIDVGQTAQDAKTGKQIGVLLNPLEMSFESGKSTSIDFPVETRIYNGCNNDGFFGRQLISVSQKSFNKWSETDIDVGFSNKYIFSEYPVESEKFYLFSKPFKFPFKVADLIVMTSVDVDYCFVDAPDSIERELNALKQDNFLVSNCSSESVNVCFEGGSDCDVEVEYGARRVVKNGESVYFEGDAMMYGAIFQDKEIYECQVKRLMQRVEQVGSLYIDKSRFISRADCHTTLETDLTGLVNSANSLSSSSGLSSMKLRYVDELNDKNYANSDCKLW